MKIWRLEKEGVGVFHSGIVWDMPDHLKEGRRARNPGSHPTPAEEGLAFSSAWFCGFTSLAQYRLWFNTKAQRAYLSEHGVVLKQYEVPSRHVQKGIAQAIFLKRNAKHVASRKPCAA